MNSEQLCVWLHCIDFAKRQFYCVGCLKLQNLFTEVFIEDLVYPFKFLFNCGNFV